jgi:predicted RecA/RadA family phage recombinase
VNPQNQAKLRRAIAAAGGAAIAKNGYVTAIDVLVGVGWLPPAKVEDWRRGRVPYLERVTVASLPKISTAMKVFRSWAKDAGLRPSETVYVSWTRDRRRLRFSKSGDPDIERVYRTHWLPPKPDG